MSSDDDLSAHLQAFGEAMEANDVAKAEAEAQQVFNLINEQPERELSLYLQWSTAAEGWANVRKWKTAEDCYLQSLTLARKKGAMATSRAADDVAMFYAFLERHDQALQYAELSVKAAKRSRIDYLHAMALRSLVYCLLRSGKTSCALKTVTQLFALVSSIGPNRMLRLDALILRARCLTRLGKLSHADSDLRAAWEILAPWTDAPTMGQNHETAWWLAKAEWSERYGSKAGTVEALQKWVACRRAAVQGGGTTLRHVVGLARALRRLAAALKEQGDRDGATLALRESCSLLEMILAQSTPHPGVEPEM